ncbi:septal ring lytic transglycosylase RlpA family protein [Oceaniradius stylonematis]|uniref:Endolytic peptidoglycan transglycosylase RlpA n=1 Tax=Oceaniradius stylonematis TaxID=2184161 RepID=A0A3A8AKR6_9HYPH|nr:septal ring lytic transglycosylase RlpA family protein [Oceaniradius stylonematis]RKF07264.1 septal ring lytic transglycosylase RlpA family protein [Oceaniradius stylonematis]RNC96609.1 MAG: septal ring lytic transglycosylase RlpA family protein [Oricola sp.]
MSIRTVATGAACAAMILSALAAPAPAQAAQQCGKASWYALTSRTASGEMMDPAKMTAAHPSLPFGTRIEVTNRANGRSVTVRVNDRGPFVHGRIVDVSKEAARRLGMVRSGIVPVCISRTG